MIDPENRQKATAVIVEILQILQRERLTIKDAQNILRVASQAAGCSLEKLETTTLVSVHEEFVAEYPWISNPQFYNETRKEKI